MELSTQEKREQLKNMFCANLAENIFRDIENWSGCKKDYNILFEGKRLSEKEKQRFAINTIIKFYDKADDFIINKLWECFFY